MALTRAVLAALALAAASPASAEPLEVVPPKPLEMPAIPYPEGATAPGPIVDVGVQLVISPTGDVSEVQLTSGAGEPFDTAVLEGVRRFRFTPALVGGQPAAVAVPYVHHFVVPPPPADEIAKGPEYDAILTGVVQERGTRKTPSGLVVLAKIGALELVTTTDDQGRFRIELPSGEVEVRVVDSAHRPFVQRERLKPAEELKVKYLIDRASYDAYESFVVGTRERTEVSRTSLTGRELTHIPGTFGDPFRVVTVLPGVTTVMTLLPYPVVRGSSPGNTGALLDGIRLPLLFHLLAGPAIVHPELIDRVDFYPGGFPVRYGGYTGGIVDGVTRRKPDKSDGTELDLALTQAGFFLRRTHESTGITGTLAARYGYPGLILKAITPLVDLSYWDYQARLDGTKWGGAWTAFVYGAYDKLEAGTADEQGNVTYITAALFQTHHADLRWRFGSDEHEKSLRLVLMHDETGAGPTTTTRALGLVPQLRLHEQLRPDLALDLGLDGSVRRLDTTRSAAEQAILARVASDTLQDQGMVYGAGAFAQLAWKPAESVMLVPGVRADVARDASDTRPSVDPRLLARWRLRQGVGETWLKGVAGLYHQPPRLALPLPGADEAKLKYDLLAAAQFSLGAEVKLSPAVELDIQTYYNRNDPVLFDLSVNADATSLLNDPPLVLPGEKPDLEGQQNRAQQAISRLIQPRVGRAFGVEVLLRKRDTKGFFGWVAYTFSRSERSIDGQWVAFDFDRRHILNVVGGLRLPRNWELGARVLFQTGTPVTTIHGYNSDRSDSQLRIDLRIDKRAVWNEWLLDFYVDVINSSVAQETGGLVGGAAFKYVLPTIGFRAVL